MKISKNKSKGKVHPSPSISSSTSTSPCSFSTCKDAASTLKLLPVTILTLISVLSPAEREVFAYVITRSIKATTSNPCDESPLLRSTSSGRKSSSSSRKMSSEEVAHIPPVFDCGCFECYTSYWFRWDSSPNREVIHQAIEAFEEHLLAGEKQQQQKKSSSSGRGKSRKERASCRRSGESALTTPSKGEEDSGVEAGMVRRSAEVAPVVEEGERKEDGFRLEEKMETSAEVKPMKEGEVVKEEEAETGQQTAGTGGGGGGNHKGLARKVLPDVIGLFHSRMWSLWSPNV